MNYTRRKHIITPIFKSRNKITRKQKIISQENGHFENKYDIVIVGGGIAGLYSAYQIVNKFPKIKILICEKWCDLGGRIQTKHVSTESGEKFDFEAGAGRFHTKQLRIVKLINELGLASKVNNTSSQSLFYDIHREHKEVDVRPPLLASTTELIVGKVIAYSKLFSIKQLQNRSFIQLAKKVLNKSEMEILVDSFGYYTELVEMNANDAIYLMVNHLNPSLQFCVLNGGLSQIIENLKKYISKYDVTFAYNTEITSIRGGGSDGGFFLKSENTDKIIHCKQCICAIPRPQLQKISLFRPLHSILQKIICSPLCRIYSVFQEQWNKSLPKLTTNNFLRIVIPWKTYPNGVTSIMSSYTDNKFARYWKKLYDKSGENFNLIHPELVHLLEQSTGLTVPVPLQSYFYYWDCGVGYWGIGADSAKISQKIIQPFPELAIYVCGENYSAENQQWIEGALETSETVVNKIISNLL